MDRMDKLDEGVPLSFVYGKRTWMNATGGERAKFLRPDSYVTCQFIPAAGHHVYADNTEKFNEAVKEIFNKVDDNKDIKVPVKLNVLF